MRQIAAILSVSLLLAGSLANCFVCWLNPAHGCGSPLPFNGNSCQASELTPTPTAESHACSGEGLCGSRRKCGNSVRTGDDCKSEQDPKPERVCPLVTLVANLPTRKAPLDPNTVKSDTVVIQYLSAAPGGMQKFNSFNLPEINQSISTTILRI